MKPKKKITNTRIEKVLIANRGEIARRIQRACHKLGIKTVSVASEADRTSLFAREADELEIIGPPAPRDSYLKVETLLKVAKDRGCDAVHPGYGFLSENADFAQAVLDAGLLFIGPSPKSIAQLGSKTGAKELARKAKVPTAPSSGAGLSNEGLVSEAKRIGYPVLVKAVAGGGGRGMRTARSSEELKEALPRARAEALKFFSNGDIYIEKLVERPRHVEVQIFGDMHGNLVHLGTRDCSTQRRHQKLIEESPAPCLSPTLREALHQAALSVARAANYYNAGTVEFLVKGEEFYFLEVNTRIQVEHPVTEVVTGLDLVELQLKVAQGERLPFAQADVTFSGHAIEFRICAEDPFADFRPASGVISKWHRPAMEGVREDFGFIEGDSVSLFYDSLISKLIVHGASRGDAIDKSIEYLKSYTLEGVFSTIALHKWLLYNGMFRSGPVDIGYVECEFSVSSTAERRNQTLRIEELRAAEELDPEWRNPMGGAVVKNLYQYQSKKFKTTYTIEILHKRDGFFVAVPVDSAGRRGKSASCRMSNGLNTAMNSIINDVLETTPPSEIFQPV